MSPTPAADPPPHTPRPPATGTRLPLPPSERTHFLWGGLLVLLVTLALRLYAVHNTDVIQRDGVTFLRMARAFEASPRAAIQAFDQHPGYPALVVAVHRISFAVSPPPPDGDLERWEHAGQWISVAAGTLATLGVWAFAGAAFGWRVAWVSALLFSVGRKWMMLGADVMSDATTLCLLIWSIVLALAAVRRGMSPLLPPRRRTLHCTLLAAASGLLAGAAYLVRPEGLGGAVVAVTVLGVMTIARRLPLRTAAPAVLACLLTAALAASPYMLAVGGLTKKKRIADLVPVAPTAQVAIPLPTPTPTPTPPPTPTPATPPAPSQPALPAPTPSAAPPPAAKPTPLTPPSPAGPANDRPGLRALVDQTVEAMQPVVFGIACVWVGITIAHFALPRRLRKPYLPLPRDPAAVLAMGVIVLLYSAVAVRLHATAGYLDWRHCMAIAFALTPLAGAGLVCLVDFGATLASPLRLKSLTVPQFIAIQWCWVLPAVMTGVAWQSFGPLHGGKSYVKDAAASLHRSAGPDGYVATNLMWVVHYSRVPGRRVETAGLDADGLFNQLRALSPRPTHLALSDRWVGDHRAALYARLTPPTFLPQGTFRQSRTRGDEEPDTIRLWKIVWPAPSAPPSPP